MFNFSKKQLLFTIISILFNKNLLTSEPVKEPSQLVTQEQFNNLVDSVEQVNNAAIEVEKKTYKTIRTLAEETFKSNTNIDNRFKVIEDQISTLTTTNNCRTQSIETLDERIGLTKDLMDAKHSGLETQISPMNQKLETHGKEIKDIKERLNSAETFILTNGDSDQKKFLSHLKNNDNPIKEYVADLTKDDSIIVKELKGDKNRSTWSTRTSIVDYINHNKTSIATGITTILAAGLVLDKKGYILPSTLGNFICLPLSLLIKWCSSKPENNQSTE